MTKVYDTRHPWSSEINFEIVETVDGRWMVLVGGVQWGTGPRDKSGASSQTWATRSEAVDAFYTKTENDTF
jgi:hypothetical protein